LPDVFFLGNLIKNYSLTFDVSVRHVTAEGPSVFDAELVAVHLCGPVGGGAVPSAYIVELGAFLRLSLPVWICFVQA